MISATEHANMTGIEPRGLPTMLRHAAWFPMNLNVLGILLFHRPISSCLQILLGKSSCHPPVGSFRRSARVQSRKEAQKQVHVSAYRRLLVRRCCSRSVTDGKS